MNQNYSEREKVLKMNQNYSEQEKVLTDEWSLCELAVWTVVDLNVCRLVLLYVNTPETHNSKSMFSC